MTDAPTLPLIALEVNTASRGGNLNKNPSAVHGMARWTSADDSVVASAQGFDFGLGPTAAAMISEPFPITPGQFVGLTYGQRRYGNSGARRVTVTARFYNASDALIGSSVISQVLWPTPSTPDQPVIEQATTGRAAPALTTSVRLEIQVGTATSHRIILRDVGIGIAATASASLATVPAPVWTSILNSGLSIVTESGASVDGVDDVLDPGSFVAVVTDPVLDPATTSALRRGNDVRLRRASGAGIWTGVVENVDADYNKDNTHTITITATDAARALHDAITPTLPGGTFTEQIAAVCYAAGLGVRSATGAFLDASDGVASREDNATAARWATRVTATHGGALWIDGDGIPRGVAAPSTAAVTTLSDAAADAGLKYTDIKLAYGSRTLVNALTVKRINTDEDEEGGKTYGPYIAVDSELAYGRVSADVEIVGGSPSAIASRLLALYSEPKRFPSEVTVDTLRDVAGTLAVTPYTAVRVKRSTVFNAVVRVLRVVHEITPTSWHTTFYFRPLETSSTVDVLVPAAGADTGPGDVAGEGFPRLVRRSRSTTQNVATGTPGTVVLWNQSLDDEGIPYDTATGEFTIPRNGRYLVAAGLTFDPNATGARVIDVRVNGSSVLRDRRLGWATTDNVIAAQAPLRLNAGHKVDVVATQNSGATRAIQTTTSSTYVAIAYLGP